MKRYLVRTLCAYILPLLFAFVLAILCLLLLRAVFPWMWWNLPGSWDL